MQRRDLSKILFASSATSLLVPANAQAQTGTAPFYAQTAAEAAAGVTPVNYAYTPGDVRRYGADPTGSADSALAIQSALNVTQPVYLPTGTYLITATLTNGISKRRIHGDGPALSILKPTGAIDAIVNTAAINCVLMDNLGIWGDTTTLDGITHATGTAFLGSRFENIEVFVGGRAFYLPGEFDTQLINCHGSSYNDNVFELGGGNSTLLQGCYAHRVPAGKYGYRIYCGAHLDSCTGIDSAEGGNWGLFGASTAAGDPVDANYAVVLTNCDIEDFNSTGVRLRGTGWAKISGCTFTAKASGTYQAELYVEYDNQLTTIENTNFYQKGAMRTARAALYGVNDFTVMMIGPCTDPHYDVAGVLYTLPVIKTSYSYLQRMLNINILDVSQLFCRYAGTATLSAGSATVAFSVPQPYAGYLVIATGNASEIFSVVNKTAAGFTIRSSNTASTASVDWMVLRTGS
jgi:hypothetical protein